MKQGTTFTGSVMVAVDARKFCIFTAHEKKTHQAAVAAAAVLSASVVSFLPREVAAGLGPRFDRRRALVIGLEIDQRKVFKC